MLILVQVLLLLLYYNSYIHFCNIFIIQELKKLQFYLSQLMNLLIYLFLINLEEWIVVKFKQDFCIPFLLLLLVQALLHLVITMFFWVAIFQLFLIVWNLIFFLDFFYSFFLNFFFQSFFLLIFKEYHHQVMNFEILRLLQVKNFQIFINFLILLHHRHLGFILLNIVYALLFIQLLSFEFCDLVLFIRELVLLMRLMLMFGCFTSLLNLKKNQAFFCLI